MRISTTLIILAAALPAAALPAPGAAPADGFRGEVVETLNAGKYTYVCVDTGGEKVWGAAPRFEVELGDEVLIPAQMPMPDFESETLGRTFEVVYFAGAIPKLGDEPPLSAATPGHGGRVPVPADPEVESIAPAAGGQTVAELYSRRHELEGEPVRLRGRVVKVLGGIMGTNWVHVQDGTGEPGRDDLTVTTDAEVAVGDTVLVLGELGVDRDFGMGYRYEIIVEGAELRLQ